MIFEHKSTIDTRMDACMVKVRKVKRKSLTESKQIIEKRRKEFIEKVMSWDSEKTVIIR